MRAKPVEKVAVIGKYQRSTRDPERDWDSPTATELRGEGSEAFAKKGGMEKNRRAATNINQGHAKEQRVVVARAHG
jgi:hypothetical protein